ncbi:MAG: hypothetical protein KDI39_13975 [Pseudomonadales bacterium]|nr:hypothetical protein [Pseudomonadales bacterium]
MSNSRKAGSVILANLAMFNEATILFENQIEPEFSKALDDVIKEWAGAKKWVGEFEEHIENGDTWIFPQEWYCKGVEEEECDSIAWFTLGFLNGDGDAYDLADLCGVGEDEMGFIFRIKYGEFGGKTAWNKFMKSLPESIISSLLGLGFNDCGKGVFFIPIKLDVNLLVAAWENEDYVDLMRPVISVLDDIEKSVPIFNEVFRQANVAGLNRLE